MTEPPAPGLQFDKAEFASNEAAAAVCAGCQTPIAGDYYDVNGRTLCPACKAQVEQVLGGRPGAAGFLKALGGGVLGGLTGALIYYAVRAVRSRTSAALHTLQPSRPRAWSIGSSGWAEQSSRKRRGTVTPATRVLTSSIVDRLIAPVSRARQATPNGLG